MTPEQITKIVTDVLNKTSNSPVAPGQPTDFKQLLYDGIKAVGIAALAALLNYLAAKFGG